MVQTRYGIEYSIPRQLCIYLYSETPNAPYEMQDAKIPLLTSGDTVLICNSLVSSHKLLPQHHDLASFRRWQLINLLLCHGKNLF